MDQDDPIHELIRIQNTPAPLPKPGKWQSLYRGLSEDYLRITFELVDTQRKLQVARDRLATAKWWLGALWLLCWGLIGWILGRYN